MLINSNLNVSLTNTTSSKYFSFTLFHSTRYQLFLCKSSYKILAFDNYFTEHYILNSKSDYFITIIH